MFEKDLVDRSLSNFGYARRAMGRQKVINLLENLDYCGIMKPIREKS